MFAHLIGIKKRDDHCFPVTSVDAWQLEYLLDAAQYIRLWHNTGGKVNGLTSETALANEISLQAIAGLTKYLISRKGMQKVLLGKFSSDPLEKRFGWFRQLSGANFYISVKQLLDAEKRIRVLGLIRNGMSLLKLHEHDIDLVELSNCYNEAANSTITLTAIDEIELEEVEQATVYYVAGYCGELK
jgi:hypothetical protein